MLAAAAAAAALFLNVRLLHRGDDVAALITWGIVALPLFLAAGLGVGLALARREHVPRATPPAP